MSRVESGSEPTVLLVSPEPAFVAVLQAELAAAGALALHSVADLAGVPGRAEKYQYELIIVHADGQVGIADLALALGGLTGGCPRVPVLVIADTYDVSEATAMFELGVADYVGWPEHGERMASLIAALAGSVGPDPSDESETRRQAVTRPS